MNNNTKRLLEESLKDDSFNKKEKKQLRPSMYGSTFRRDYILRGV